MDLNPSPGSNFASLILATLSHKGRERKNDRAVRVSSAAQICGEAFRPNFASFL
jgi:hypothetical protein